MVTVLSDAINALASLMRSPMAVSDESEAISADASGLTTLAKDVRALSDVSVALAEYRAPAVDENGACANAAMPNLRRPHLLVLVYSLQPATSNTLGSLCWQGRMG